MCWSVRGLLNFDQVCISLFANFFFLLTQMTQITQITQISWAGQRTFNETEKQ